MSRTIARLLLSMLLMPLMAVVYITGIILASEFGSFRDWQECLVGATATAVVAAAYWLAVWRTAVRWTLVRIRHTLLAAVTCIVAGGLIAALLNLFIPYEDWFKAFVGSGIAILGWLIATVFLWRETPIERAQRLAKLGAGNVACPACGYNLTGLKTTTCPECGASFSIQELVAAAKGIGELEG